MRKHLTLLTLITVLLLTALSAAGQLETAEPTQTPYVVYVVVTATPEPTGEMTITRPDTQPTNAVSLVNTDGTASGSNTTSDVTIVNNGSTSVDRDEIVRSVVSTLYAQSSAAVSSTPAPVAVGNGALVTQSDGSTCTLSMELVEEPSWSAGEDVAYGEVFWKEWIVRNTGTCTWTPDYYFVFDSGWQIGNTRFTMNKTTAPGETLTVRLGLTAQLDPGRTYYSTYILEAPDGTRSGTLTARFTVRNASYFAPTPTWGPPPRRPGPGPHDDPHDDPHRPPRPPRDDH